MLEAGKMDKQKDNFDKGQIVMARQLGQRMYKTASLVGPTRYAVVSTLPKVVQGRRTGEPTSGSRVSKAL